MRRVVLFVYQSTSSSFRRLPIAEATLSAVCSVIDLSVGARFSALKASKSRKQPDPRNLPLSDAVAHGTAVAWQHLNLLGEYDFSDENLRDSIGIRSPKLVD
jgi:hypothetical protein